MRSISDVLISHLANERIRYHRHSPDRSRPALRCFVLPFAVENFLLACRVFIDDRKRCIRVETGIGIRAQRRRYPLVCEYIARANQELNLGCFQLDMCSGEITFVISAAVEDAEVSEKMLQKITMSCFPG